MDQNTNSSQLENKGESMLYRILQEILDEVEYPGFFDKVEYIRMLALKRRHGDLYAEAEINAIIQQLFREEDLKEAQAIASALTLYFDLTNLAEEQQRISSLWARRQAQDAEPDRDTIEAAIVSLKAAGVTAEQLGQLLDNLAIELIFTAHPSETRRRTIIAKHQRIASIIHSLTHFNILPGEREAFEEELKAQILTLWLTNRAPLARPTVEDEVRTGLYYLDSTLWDVLPRLYADLEKSLARHYPATPAPKHAWLQMGSWIGGDRDGHPGVTHNVTAETLRLHRELAVRRYSNPLQTLSRQLSIHVESTQKKPSLLREANEQHETFKHALDLQSRYRNEPLRLTAALLAAKLDKASGLIVKPQRIMSTRCRGSFPCSRARLSDNGGYHLQQMILGVVRIQVDTLLTGNVEGVEQNMLPLDKRIKKVLNLVVEAGWEEQSRRSKNLSRNLCKMCPSNGTVFEYVIICLSLYARMTIISQGFREVLF